MRFDEQFVHEALANVSILCSTVKSEYRFCIDSRQIVPGDFFIALKGAQCDGHDFILDAFERGAAGCLLAQEKQDIVKKISQKIRDASFIIAVPNTHDAFVQLAAAWRAQFTCPVVAIAGSVGKTSTKEMISNILALHGDEFVVSYANQNTVLGVSLNILRMRVTHKIAIFEVGISRRGEMAKLAALLKPTTALITNIGHQHMDGLGALHDIALEKRNIFKLFTEETIGIINGDQQILAQVSYSHPVLKFGTKTTNQIQARKIRQTGTTVSFVLKLYKEKYPVVLKSPHMGAVFNALGAASVAHLLNIPHETIIKGVQLSLVVAGRFEQRALKNHAGYLINDCYNANPESMKASLTAFQHIETAAYKIAVLGDMLGLGVNSPFWHRQLGRFLRKIPALKEVILVGSMVQWTKKTAPAGISIHIVPTWQDAAALLEKKLTHESFVLVKGSYGVGLGNIVETFTGAPAYAFDTTSQQMVQ